MTQNVTAFFFSSFGWSLRLIFADNHTMVICLVIEKPIQMNNVDSNVMQLKKFFKNM